MNEMGAVETERLTRRALRLAQFTVAYNVIERDGDRGYWDNTNVYTVPAGWANSDDWPSMYAIMRGSSYSAGGVNDGVVTPDTITLLARPSAASLDACAEKPEPGVGTDRAALAVQHARLYERELRDKTRAFAEANLAPHVQTWWDSETIPRDLIREFGKLGIIGMRCDDKNVEHSRGLGAGD